MAYKEIHPFIWQQEKLHLDRCWFIKELVIAIIDYSCQSKVVSDTVLGLNMMRL